jgi:hypothetical protein
VVVRIAIVLAILAAVGHGARADEAAAWEALRARGHIALMRHTSAPGGAGDPPGFTLGDCTTQRNLGAEGRVEQAWRGPGNLLIVTHGANIRALTGISPASGEIVVTKLGANGSIEPVGRIPPSG